jgi:hypothetical protein
MELIMKFVSTAATLVAAALLIGAPAFAQTKDGNPGGPGFKQHVGAPGAAVADNSPGGAGYKQKVGDGNSPTTGGTAYKQKTQSLSHGTPEKQN